MKTLNKHFILFLAFWCFAAKADSLTFQSALDRIVERSTGVSVQKSNRDQTYAKNLPARLAFLPSLSFNAKEPLAGTESFLATPRQLELTTQWNLFRFGSDFFGLSAARSEEKAQDFLVDDSVLQAEETGVQALVNQIHRSKEVLVLQKIVLNRSESLRIAEQRFKSGLLSRQEADTLIVDLENARARQIDTENQVVETTAILENLLGNSSLELEWPWKDLLSQKEFLKEEPFKTFDLSRRPDWQAAQIQVWAEEGRKKQARSLLLPSVDTQFSYGVYEGFFGSMTGWTGAIVLNWSIFDQLVTYSNFRVQAQNQVKREFELVQTERDALAEWKAAKQTLERNIESALARDRTLILSRKLYQDNLRRFQAGLIDANDLAIDQNRLFDSELFAIQGWASAHLSFSKFCHAIGNRIKTCTSFKSKL